MVNQGKVRKFPLNGHTMVIIVHFPQWFTQLTSFTAMCAIKGRKCTLMIRCLIAWVFLTNILLVLYCLTNSTHSEIW